jgi:hypothetical protein
MAPGRSIAAALSMLLIGTAGAIATQPPDPVNPLIGTWVSTDVGCADRIVADRDLYGVHRPSTGRPSASWSMTQDPVYVVAAPTAVSVRREVTSTTDRWFVTESWTFPDPNHATLAGSDITCRYVRQ